uniref:MAGE domain-containing protein n=1 Tax=Suricata suricatta TaxID=37032 RepID=A0A673TYW6_SURSU
VEEVKEQEEPQEEPIIALSPPQSPQSTSFSAPESTSEGGCNNQEIEDKSAPQTSTDTKSLPKDPLDEVVADVVRFMVLKYQLKELITEEHMLNVILKRYKKHFPVIFKKASKCLEVVCGIELIMVDLTVQAYALVDALDLTLDEVSSDSHSMPKNGLLVLILGVIFIEGNRVSEEDLWEYLNIMGVYAGREHFIYGEPRKLITIDWVRENYLEYRQVPGSDPPRYEFLWGPRAHAEITKRQSPGRRRDVFHD